jgi:pimeloyl-ACP methyl ester carboxylesterase
MNDDPKGNYAEVNGLDMYYEVHGTGRPLVVLHGAYMTIGTMGPVVPALAESRQVIAVELQGHGHTADADRPLTYEQMANDVAALMDHLGLEDTDVFGFSMGGGVALQVAIRHPEVVRKLVVVSVSYTSDGMHPELLEMIPTMTPEIFAGSPLEDAYLRTAPNPEDFPTLVAKLKQLDMQPYAWPPEDIQGIAAPTLFVIGDSDAIRLEHAVELFRLLGGGVMGDLAGLPKSQLAVLPGTTHFVPPGSGVLDRALWLLPMIAEFLDVPMPEEEVSSDEQESDLPGELARPARRALTGAGYVRLEQLTRLSEAEVLKLHGMGPKALDQIRRALAARGQSFADGS